jgi:ATP-dependent DNA helicase RecG
VSPEAGARLDVFVRTDDGFEIARADLRLRGMGDLFGEQQSGQSTFRVADPLRDEALNETAREIADKILAEDPELESAANAPLKRALGSRYARAMELFRVG